MDIVPTQSSGKTILNILNNDCIRAILLRMTNLEDFLSVAEVCIRFQENAVNCFRSMFTEVSINCNIRHERTESLLYNFGHLIEKIELKSTGDRQRDDKLLYLISTFGCQTLKCLVISIPNQRTNNLDMNNPRVIELHQLEALQELELDGARPSFIRFDSPVKELTIRNIQLSDNEIPWFVRPFPQLECVWFTSVENITQKTLVNFLSLNPKLARLIMRNCHQLPSFALEIIACFSPNLEYLNLWGCCLSPSPPEMHSLTKKQIIAPILGKLRKLRSLDMRHIYYGLSVEELINMIVENNSPIEMFAIIPVNSHTSRITNMLTLKTLTHIIFDGDISERLLRNLLKTQTALEKVSFELQSQPFAINNLPSHISFMLKHSSNLTEIKYYLRGMDFNLKVYESILALVKNRAHIVIVNVDGTNDVPKHILKANEDWIDFY